MCPKCGHVQEGNFKIASTNKISGTKTRYGITCSNCKKIFFNTANNIVSPILEDNEPFVYLKLNDKTEMVKRGGIKYNIYKTNRYRKDFMFKMRKKDWDKYNKISQRTGDINYEKKILKPLYYNNKLERLSQPFMRKDLLIELNPSVIQFYERTGKLPLEGQLDKVDDPEQIIKRNKRKKKKEKMNKTK